MDRIARSVWLWLALANASPGVAAKAASPAVLDDTGYVGLRLQKIDLAHVRAAFPGTTVRKHRWDAEGETFTVFEVKRGAKTVVEVIDVQITIYDPALRTRAGLGIGSTFEELEKVYPQLHCWSYEMGIGGSGGGTVCQSDHSALAFEMTHLPEREGGYDKPCRAGGPACCPVSEGDCNAAALAGGTVERIEVTPHPKAPRAR